MATPNVDLQPAACAARTFVTQAGRTSDLFSPIVVSLWEQRANAAMTDESDRPVPVEQMARACGMSERSFLRRFKETTGKTPRQWLMTQRIAKAQSLLLARVPLVDVAQDCGFADQSHFTRVFARWIGHPPGRWLRLHRG